MKKLFSAALIVVAFVAILMLSNTARADDAVLKWTNPTTNTDGTAIPATGPGSLTTANVERGSCTATDTFGTRADLATVPAGPATHTFVDLPVGKHCFRLSVSNVEGKTSAFSAVVVKSVVNPAPKVPTGVTVTIVPK